MKRRTFLFRVAAFGTSTITLWKAFPAYAAEASLVILNARNPTGGLTKGQLRALFMGNIGFWHGVVPVKLYRRPDQSDASSGFFEPLLGMSIQAYQAHWDKLQLSGKAIAPPILGSLPDLLRSVAENPGSVSYISAQEQSELHSAKIIPIK